MTLLADEGCSCRSCNNRQMRVQNTSNVYVCSGDGRCRNVVRPPLAGALVYKAVMAYLHLHVRVATRAGVWLGPQVAPAMAQSTRIAAEAEGGACLADSVADRTPCHRQWRQHGLGRSLRLPKLPNP